LNSLVVIAFGGACGAVLRFLVSSGVYQWLGRGFPYGTLTVNVLGSFLIGLLTQSLVLQRVALSMEYRSAILVGLLGSFTTFSTFSLETITLLEQGELTKATLNITLSLMACLLAVWLGMLMGRNLPVAGDMLYGLMIVNMLGALIIGFIGMLLMTKVTVNIDHQVISWTLLVGLFVIFSGLYLMLSLVESGHSLNTHTQMLVSVFFANTLLSIAMVSLGAWLGRQI